MYMKGYFIGWVFVIALCMAIIHNNPVTADTSVSGYISADTTWTSANSPYIVTGNVVVKSGVTLTIEPGVTVKVDSGKSIQVDGALIAKGTSASKITFTKNSSNWGYILFSDSSTDGADDADGNYTSGSVLEYCVVEYAGGVSVSDNGAVRINNASPFINYCTIKNNSASGIYAWNLSGTLKIKNNTISNNTASSYGGGIYTYGGTVIISGNTISNNTASSYGGGIYSSSGTISGNTISNNTASSSGGGIYTSGNITVTKNSLTRNSAKNASAVYFTNGSSKDFTYNTIMGNKATDASNTYTVYISSNPTFNYNNIFSNTATYELWNGNAVGSSNLDAKNN